MHHAITWEIFHAVLGKARPKCTTVSWLTHDRSGNHLLRGFIITLSRLPGWEEALPIATRQREEIDTAHGATLLGGQCQHLALGLA